MGAKQPNPPPPRDPNYDCGSQRPTSPPPPPKRDHVVTSVEVLSTHSPVITIRMTKEGRSGVAMLRVNEVVMIEDPTSLGGAPRMSRVTLACGVTFYVDEESWRKITLVMESSGD